MTIPHPENIANDNNALGKPGQSVPTELKLLGPASGPAPQDPPATDRLQLEGICKDLAAKYAPTDVPGEEPGSSPIRVALQARGFVPASQSMSQAKTWPHS